MSSRKPKPAGVNKDMAKYYLLLEKIARRVEHNTFDSATNVLLMMTREYDQNKREMFHQRMCDYAYGED